MLQEKIDKNKEWKEKNEGENTMTIASNLSSIIIQTIANVISNAAWFILIFLGFKAIIREIKKISKEIPIWIENYHKKEMERIRVSQAIDRRGT